jgi:hypothetical protein
MDHGRTSTRKKLSVLNQEVELADNDFHRPEELGMCFKVDTGHQGDHISLGRF